MDSVTQEDIGSGPDAEPFRLALQFLSPETVVISVMVDTIIFGFLFVLALGMCHKTVVRMKGD